MARKHQQPAPLIRQLEDAPGPEADGPTLSAHYRRVQGVIACRRYDEVVLVCGWCLAYEQAVRPVGTREPFKFCTKRCAEAHEAYFVKCLGKGKATPPTAPTLEEAIAQREQAKQVSEREERRSYGSGRTRA